MKSRALSSRCSRGVLPLWSRRSQHENTGNCRPARCITAVRRNGRYPEAGSCLQYYKSTRTVCEFAWVELGQRAGDAVSEPVSERGYSPRSCSGESSSFMAWMRRSSVDWSAMVIVSLYFHYLFGCKASVNYVSTRRCAHIIRFFQYPVLIRCLPHQSYACLLLQLRNPYTEFPWLYSPCAFQ